MGWRYLICSARQASLLRRLKLLILASLGAVNMVGCSPAYVVRAAYEQGKILLARRDIEQVVAKGDLSPEDREKLSYVLEARKFAAEIGLNPGGSFTTYADIGKETLAWVVMASRKDAFAPHTWWFPIVGTVPYKGYFSESAARGTALDLERKGLESSVRGTEAFSTLGWFNDPLLSTTLRNSVVRIVNTVLHESVHSTVWIKGDVPFNESLANFVGNQATVDFFRMRKERGDQRGAALLEQAERDYGFQREFSGVVTRLHKELSELYARQDISSEQKIALRQGVFDRVCAPFRERYPKAQVLRSINNAELMQFVIYMTDLDQFERLFISSGRSWPTFIKRIEELRAGLEQGAGKGAFEVLRLG